MEIITLFGKIKATIKRSRIYSILKIFRGSPVIVLEYSSHPEPRYGYGKPPHPKLYDIINKNRSKYEMILRDFFRFENNFLNIGLSLNQTNSQEPYWINGYLPGLDAISIYAFLSLENSSNYMEVGSGNSTRFAKKAIRDHSLSTKIITIDPCPRVKIEGICDKFIKNPLENVELHEFDLLRKGDVLFIDNSHRAFMNSDVVVFFLDILPRLQPGVLVGIHDICLPYDYPPAYKPHYYSEQYLLASYLLAEGEKIEIILPNYFISQDARLLKCLAPLYSKAHLSKIEKHGCIFWFKIR